MQRISRSASCLPVAACGVAMALAMLSSRSADAQIVPDYQRYQPLGAAPSPGLAARAAELRGLASPYWFQPLRVIVEDGADVAIYHNRPIQSLTLNSPAQFGAIVGHSYRLQLSNLTELPGVELYPTIELIDRMHPPAGEEHNFPVPIHISREAIDLALAGRMVTQVIYVEQPQLAAPFALDEATRIRPLLPTDDPLKQADRYGRPIAILRIGARQPATIGENMAFYGTGGPISESQPTRAINDSGDITAPVQSGGAAQGGTAQSGTAQSGTSIRAVSPDATGTRGFEDSARNSAESTSTAPLLRLPEFPTAGREEVVR